ncbi:hypothetical protein ACSZOL_21700 [Aeromonas hydrophila]|uniref:Uncharacterized protein n=1 Tax=Aeromonas allosaccharophila TaxID=656 RepID=A0AAX3NUL0_9GAMM|nr:MULTISPECIES: hypothetical protein [Aeromonas]WED77834.1 hypothetical protein PYU98_06310 [Aeromonas allosaccharophila]
MSNQPGFWLATRQLSLAALLLGLTPQVVFAADCTYREDALGHTRYQCNDGKQGTLREDALGNIKDSGTGITWRTDSLGHLKGSDGTTYREDTLGNVRGSNLKTGERVTWREDSLGNLRASDGTVCRVDALARLKCTGDSRPPSLLMGK